MDNKCNFKSSSYSRRIKTREFWCLHGGPDCGRPRACSANTLSSLVLCSPWPETSWGTRGCQISSTLVVESALQASHTASYAGVGVLDAHMQLCHGRAGWQLSGHQQPVPTTEAAFLTARYMLKSVVELQWNWQYQQCGISLVEIPQESAGMGIACAATDLTPGLGFSHRCGSKVNSVERVKGALQSLWNFPSFHCTFITTVWNPWARPCDDIIPFLNSNFWKRLVHQQCPSKERYVGYPLPSWLHLHSGKSSFLFSWQYCPLNQDILPSGKTVGGQTPTLLICSLRMHFCCRLHYLIFSRSCNNEASRTV